MKVVRIIFAIALIAPTAWGQTKPSRKSGSLSGTVVDASGKVIVGVKVTLKGIRPKQLQLTDKDGAFSFASLPSGFYHIAVEKVGFKPAHVQMVEIVPGKSSAIRIGLVTPKQAQVFEITDDPITVDTTSTCVQTNTDTTSAEKIPHQSGVGGIISGP